MGLHQWHVPPGAAQFWLNAPWLAGGKWGKVEVGVLPWWRPNLSINPSFITLLRNATGLQQSITENMQAYTVLPLLRNDMFLCWKPTHPSNWPFSFANLHDDGELKHQRTPWPGQIRINLTSAVLHLHFSCWFWLWNNNRLTVFLCFSTKCVQLVLEYAHWSLIFFCFRPTWKLVWCQVALGIQRTPP